jgi:hypothetical protein
LASRDNKRALKTIRTLRLRQQKQADQIEMLCCDMVSAHREFSTKLSTLKFVTSFYESLLQCADLPELFHVAINGIREAVDEIDAAVFLLSEDGFDVHVADAGVSDSVEKRQFRHWFGRELVGRISQMNRVCSMERFHLRRSRWAALGGELVLYWSIVRLTCRFKAKIFLV